MCFPVAAGQTRWPSGDGPRWKRAADTVGFGVSTLSLTLRIPADPKWLTEAGD
jgi:hypothetical protein